MNKNDRKELEKAISLLKEAQEIIESIKDGEQDKFDNLSEGLQQTENGQKFEEIVSNLDEAYSNIEDAMTYIDDSIQ